MGRPVGPVDVKLAPVALGPVDVDDRTELDGNTALVGGPSVEVCITEPVELSGSVEGITRGLWM
jgi:hypothetical protein